MNSSLKVLAMADGVALVIFVKGTSKQLNIQLSSNFLHDADTVSSSMTTDLWSKLTAYSTYVLALQELHQE